MYLRGRRRSECDVPLRAVMAEISMTGREICRVSVEKIHSRDHYPLIIIISYFSKMRINQKNKYNVELNTPTNTFHLHLHTHEHFFMLHKQPVKYPYKPNM